MKIEYEVVRSKRRTVGIQIKNGRVTVRAPLRAPTREIERIVEKHLPWIEKRLAADAESREKKSAAVKLTDAEMSVLAEKARAFFPETARRYALLWGVEFNRVTLRFQHTRWGSCSAKKNLNFNCLLMLAPTEVAEAIAAHEVCHLRHMNHSPEFYADLLSVMPDYRERERWLKAHGDELLARLPDGRA